MQIGYCSTFFCMLLISICFFGVCSTKEEKTYRFETTSVVVFSAVIAEYLTVIIFSNYAREIEKTTKQNSWQKARTAFQLFIVGLL